MKLYHVSDLHIGRDFNGYDLIDDQRYTLNALANMIDENKIKYLLLAGDIFDKYNPSNEAMELFEDFITRVSKLGTRIIIISGNHDSKARLGYLSGFLRKDNIYIYTSIPKEPVEFNEDGISIMPIPYLHDFELKSIYRDMDMEPNEIYKALIDEFHSKCTKGNKQICMCHNLILGGKVSSSERTLSVGGLEEMKSELFYGFDYTALGHLHICQHMGHNIYYSGSICKYSTSEFNNKNSILAYDTLDDSVERIELPQKRGARILRDTIDNILKNAKTDPRLDDFIAVELTDDGIAYDAFGRISEYYPNVVSLSQRAMREKKVENEINVQIDKNDPLEVFNEFYSYLTNEEPKESEIALVKDILNEINEEEK